MIKKVEVSNYKSIGANECFDLGPMTVLVGRNGSGKSNVVDVLQFVADCLKLGLEGAVTKRHGIRAIRRWSSGHPHSVSIQLHLSGDAYAGMYAFRISGDKQEEYRVQHEAAQVRFSTGEEHSYRITDGEWETGPDDLRPDVSSLNLALPLIAGDRRFKALADEMKMVAVYSIFPDALRNPQKYDPARPMHVHGNNWVSILKDQSQESWKGDLIEALRSLTGDVEDIRVNPVAGFLTVQLRHAVVNGGRNKWFESNQESDGTLRVAGIITAMLQEPKLSLVGIEEPELTVHPGALPLLADFLKQASKDSQTLFTTHSPDLMDQFDVEDIRVVQREDGVTTIREIGADQLREVKTKLRTLSEIMRSEGISQLRLPLDDGGSGE